MFFSVGKSTCALAAICSWLLFLDGAAARSNAGLQVDTKGQASDLSYLRRSLEENDPCNVAPSIKRSMNYDGPGTDDSIRSPILQLDNIDKIIRIKVYAGDYWFNFVVSKLEVTYRLKDGSETTLSRGNGGTLQGTMDFADGVYLTGISMQVGAYVDYVKLCASNGECKGPWGGKRNLSPNQSLNNDRSVIKAIFGKNGDVVDRLGCYFEANKLYRAELQDFVYEDVTEPFVSEKSFNDPKAVEILENFDTSSEQSSEIEFSTTVSTSETSTVTESRELSVEVSVSVSVSAVFVDASFGVTVGSSFSSSFEQSHTEEFEESISRTYTVVAQPGTKVTAEIYYQEVEYEYNWDAPVQCYFQHAPSIAVNGHSFKGTIVGSQVIPQGLVRLTEEKISSSDLQGNDPQDEDITSGTQDTSTLPSEGDDLDADSTSTQLSSSFFFASLCGMISFVVWGFGDSMW